MIRTLVLEASTVTKGRFWSAFENGDLPEYVTNSRQRTTRNGLQRLSLQPWFIDRAPVNALLALTPSTACNLARIKHPKAKAIAEQHLQAHEFIGHDAASYLAKTDLDDDVLDELKLWIKNNETKALVPSGSCKVESDVRISQQPASHARSTPALPNGRPPRSTRSWPTPSSAPRRSLLRIAPKQLTNS